MDRKIGIGIAFGVALGIAAPALAQEAVQWRVEDGGNGHWYARLARTSESWNALLATARIMGGDLASIASSSENAFVRSVAFVAEGSTGHAAIGAASPGGTCTVPWQWSDGTQFVFSNWDTDQPNCLPPWNEEVTLMYTSGAWHDYPRTGYIGVWTSAVIEWSADCNGDGIVDYGQILDGTFEDTNSNGVPDCCDRTIIAWGSNEEGQASPPVHPGNVVSVSAGYDHSTCLLASGGVLAWGSNAHGQCIVPPDLTFATRVSAGDRFVLALQHDGTVRAWGYNGFGQCNVPSGLAGVVEISAGGNHSMVQLADGTLRCWGNNTSGQCSVPADLGPVSMFEGGVYHSVAVRASGAVRCWGLDDYGQCSPPAGISGVIAVSGGDRHSVALRSGGEAICWGQNSFGQCTVPPGTPPLAAISASDRYTLALTTSGTVVRWGQPHGIPPGGDVKVAMISAGAYHGLAVLATEDCVDPCPSDIDENGVTDAIDLAVILSRWGTNPKDYPRADANGDGIVDANDLAIVLGGWGSCP